MNLRALPGVAAAAMLVLLATGCTPAPFGIAGLIGPFEAVAAHAAGYPSIYENQVLGPVRDVAGCKNPPDPKTGDCT